MADPVLLRSVNWAKVRSDPSGTKSGSYPKPWWPRGSKPMLPSQHPSKSIGLRAESQGAGPRRGRGNNGTWRSDRLRAPLRAGAATWHCWPASGALLAGRGRRPRNGPNGRRDYPAGHRPPGRNRRPGPRPRGTPGGRRASSPTERPCARRYRRRYRRPRSTRAPRGTLRGNRHCPGPRAGLEVQLTLCRFRVASTRVRMPGQGLESPPGLNTVACGAFPSCWLRVAQTPARSGRVLAATVGDP
jgi:hypothetical protein